MYRPLLSLAVATAFLGCSSDSRPVVRGWTASAESRDSLLTGVSDVLGYSPDTVEWCGPRKLRLAFVDRPGEFPMRNVRGTDGGFVLHLPRTEVDHNLVRAIAYAIEFPVREVGADTIVLTLNRTPAPRDGSGPVRASFQLNVADLRDRIGNGSNDAAPVMPVMAAFAPCDRH